MSKVILITVRLQEGRYHGMGDGPPSPARLFQALVAGAGLSGPLNSIHVGALKWLEQCAPPVMAAPHMTNGKPMTNFVPNNDLDAKGGDPRRIGVIRTKKQIRPKFFDSNVPFLYAWFLDSGNDAQQRQADVICGLAERLYQLGRTVDMAWASAEILNSETLATRLREHDGIIYSPSAGVGGKSLPCPMAGSLESLVRRYAEQSLRFETVSRGRSFGQTFRQQSKARFRQIAYDSPPLRRVYELRPAASDTSLTPWPLAQASRLVVGLRDSAATRLHGAFPDRSSLIERFLVGRKANGADEGPTSFRVRIIPMPSIGHHHADRGIRRVLVEVPAECLLRADDVHWAFSGIEFVDPKTGEVITVTPTEDESMLSRFGIGGYCSSMWRTVTPVALPESASRRRIDPAHKTAQAKAGTERAAEQARAGGAVIQALRFAGIRAWADLIRVQREPFEGNGERVESFASGTRFGKDRLWHVEVSFRQAITGPLVIGDGRFLGLGIMVPVQG